MLLLHEYSDTLLYMIENLISVDEDSNEETEVEDDIDADEELEDVLTTFVVCSTCTSIWLDIDIIIYVLDVLILVLKAVETTASTVVELDITEVVSVVKVAVSTKHLTVPDC